MSLDRHKILSELGSVMNQLKNADCGCMGKVFGDTGQCNPLTGYSTPTCYGCRESCCHGHGNRWDSNTSCDKSFPNNTKHMYGHCMGHCNPPKLYADTYSYLNKNLMQPAVNEVYNDLKSLTPANTVVNNPIANQMGLTRDGFIGQGQSGNMNAMPTNEVNQMNPMGGMGPQILNMLGGNLPKNNTLTDQASHLSGPLPIDDLQSSQGQIGDTSMTNKMFSNNIIAQSPNINQTTMQPSLKDNTQNNMYINPANHAQQMQSSHHPHGQHTQGIAKFNEMFPGVSQGLGGDLGFDPMAIAIQMNPANKQQAAMDTMYKMMQNNKIENVFDQSMVHKQPGGVITNTTTSHLPANQLQNNLQTNRIEGLDNRIQHQPIEQTSTTRSYVNSPDLRHQNINNLQPNTNTNNYSFQTPQNNQQIYNMESGEPKQQILNQTQLQETVIDPNTGNITTSPILPGTRELMNDLLSTPNQHVNQTVPEAVNSQQIMKEPIFPADTSNSRVPKQKYQYNTLGQPVEMLSAKTYYTPDPPLPQTLSPQPVPKSTIDPSKYSTVKSTVSKTSLIGNSSNRNTPNQLQQMYNQYKGSQSYTRQNIGSVVKPATHSEGNLNTAPSNYVPSNVPIEKLGGDTQANNQIINNYEQESGRIGDGPGANKPIGDSIPDRVSNRKCRNGLQDIVYTSYPSSAAWTFHGPDKAPYNAGYRQRKKY